MPTKLLQMIKIAQQPETLLGTLLLLQEQLNQLMLWLIHIQIILSMFNLKVSLDRDSMELLTLRFLQLPILAPMPTKLPPMMNLVQLMETQLGIPSQPQEPKSQLML